MGISRRSLALLAEAIDARFTQAMMNGLVFEYGLEQVDPGGSVKNRAVAFVRNLEASRNPRLLVEAVQQILLRLELRSDRELHTQLLESLRLDDLEFVDGRLLSTSPAPAAIGEQISLLEQELRARGFTTASEHYRQAVDNFTRSNWEAANSQTRSFTEELIIRFGSDVTGVERSDPGAALQDLRQGGFLDDPEWNQLRGFWSGIQDNGPHHGLSGEQEALFRLHCCTAIARYLLAKQR